MTERDSYDTRDWELVSPFANEVAPTLTLISSITVIWTRPYKPFLLWEVLQ